MWGVGIKGISVIMKFLGIYKKGTPSGFSVKDSKSTVKRYELYPEPMPTSSRKPSQNGDFVTFYSRRCHLKCHHDDG